MTLEFELVKIYMNDVYCPYTLSPRFADSREVYAIKVEGEYFVLGEKGSSVYIGDLEEEEEWLNE